MSAGFDLIHWRIPGVLQRFGITYFVVALTELLTVELYARWNVSEGETRSECVASFPVLHRSYRRLQYEEEVNVAGRGRSEI